MANSTPSLSARDEIDQFIRRRFDEVVSEKDAAVNRLNTTIPENTKLKNAYAGCWHIIAIKQNEINALHDKIWQLQRDLGRERQRNKDMTGIGMKEATHQDTNSQPDTTTPAITTIDDPFTSTTTGHQNDDGTTPEDVTAEPESDLEIIEVDNAGSPQTAPKKRKKQTKRVWPDIQAAKRFRRATKPGAQEQTVHQDAVLDVPVFFVDYKNEIVREDGNALSEDIQAAFDEQMTELATKEKSPRGDWRFADKKGNCVRCTVSNQTSYWTVEGPRQYTCRTCANAYGICIL